MGISTKNIRRALIKAGVCVASIQLASLLTVCDQNGWRRPVALQPAYSLLKRDIEKDILPLCQREQIAVLLYQVLQGSLLTAKYKHGFEAPKDSRQVEKPEWMMALTDEMFTQLEQIKAEAQKQGRTLLEHALKSLLEKPTLLSFIIDVKNIPQLESLITSVK